jgi:hypothetical protein
MGRVEHDQQVAGVGLGALKDRGGGVCGRRDKEQSEKKSGRAKAFQNSHSAFTVVVFVRKSKVKSIPPRAMVQPDTFGGR